MLSEIEINDEIQLGNIFDPLTVLNGSFKVQSSSIDLSVKTIHIPDCQDNKKTRSNHILMPGETVILELNEKFQLAKNLAGVIFPRNTLSKNGIIMTNPGHIDPGYNGIISIYLVNMSKEPFSLTQNSAVARMLLFKTIISTKGYQGKIVNKLDDDQLSRMGKDFAGLDKRLPKEINKIIAKKTGLIIAIAALMLTLITLAIPFLFQIVSSNVSSTKDLELTIKVQQNEINNLKSTVELLKNAKSNEPKVDVKVSTPKAIRESK